MERDKTEINELAKKMAIINVYAIINPLRTFLATGNISLLESSAEKNVSYKGQNGKKMYEYIKSVVEELKQLDTQTIKSVLSDYNKYNEEEMEKFVKIVSETTGKDISYGCSFNQIVDENGNILIVVEDCLGVKKETTVFS